MSMVSGKLLACPVDSLYLLPSPAGPISWSMSSTAHTDMYCAMVASRGFASGSSAKETLRTLMGLASRLPALPRVGAQPAQTSHIKLSVSVCLSVSLSLC